jgi:hypothetical protein
MLLTSIGMNSDDDMRHRRLEVVAVRRRHSSVRLVTWRCQVAIVVGVVGGS